MHNNSASLAKAYYTAIARKDVKSIEQYLHPDVVLVGPMDKKSGKAAVMEAIDQYAQAIESLEVRSVCGGDMEAMVLYKFVFPAPIGGANAASYLKFENGLIVHIEPIYDTRPFFKN